MVLGRSLLFKIKNMSCEFRSINTTDVNQGYIDGLKEHNKYLMNIPAAISFSSQKKYIKEIINSKNDTICGLFLDNELVGTAGIQLSLSGSCFQDTQSQMSKLATIGIFIFNTSFRGMGLGKTLVWAATYLFHNHTKSELFGAGMEKENVPSLKSFLSCGFRQVSEDKKNYTVLLNYSGLIKPDFIRDEGIQVVNTITS